MHFRNSHWFGLLVKIAPEMHCLPLQVGPGLGLSRTLPAIVQRCALAIKKDIYNYTYPKKGHSVVK